MTAPRNSSALCVGCGEPIPAGRGSPSGGSPVRWCSSRCVARIRKRRFRGVLGPGRRMPSMDGNFSKGRAAELLVLNALRAQGLLVVDVADRARSGKYVSKYDLAVVLPDGPDGGFCRVEVKCVRPDAPPSGWHPSGSFDLNRRHTLGTLPFDVLAVVRSDGSFRLFPSFDAWRSGAIFDPAMVSMGVHVKRRQRKAAILKLQQPLQFPPTSKDP